MKLSSLLEAIESHWPLKFSEDWDAPGLVVGDRNQEVKTVLFTVDVTAEVLAEAIRVKADLIIAHHPFLLRGVKFLAEDSAKGSVLTGAIRNGIAIYAAHTNADNAIDGVSETLANALGLSDLVPLVPISPEIRVGAGRVGMLGRELTLGQFAQLVASVLPATVSGVRVSGGYDSLVSKVAVCGGAGDSFIDVAFSLQADVYVTADLRHHPVQDAAEKATASGRNFALIEVSHWASEALWLKVAAEKLSGEFSQTDFLVSTTNTDPWNFVIQQ